MMTTVTTGLTCLFMVFGPPHPSHERGGTGLLLLSRMGMSALPGLISVAVWRCPAGKPTVSGGRLDE
jgi:hypothetical protein